MFGVISETVTLIEIFIVYFSLSLINKINKSRTVTDVTPRPDRETKKKNSHTLWSPRKRKIEPNASPIPDNDIPSRVIFSIFSIFISI